MSIILSSTLDNNKPRVLKLYADRREETMYTPESALDRMCVTDAHPLRLTITDVSGMSRPLEIKLRKELDAHFGRHDPLSKKNVLLNWSHFNGRHALELSFAHRDAQFAAGGFDIDEGVLQFKFEGIEYGKVRATNMYIPDGGLRKPFEAVRRYKSLPLRPLICAS